LNSTNNKINSIYMFNRTICIITEICYVEKNRIYYVRGNSKLTVHIAVPNIENQ